MTRLFRFTTTKCWTLMLVTVVLAQLTSVAMAQQTTKRWFPGHYLYTADEVNHLGMKDSRRNLIRTNPNFAGYKIQYWWWRLEPRKGVYDFSMIIADLDKAHADGKKVIVHLMERSFHASSRPFPVPSYIRDEYNGTWRDGEKIFIKIWDSAVAERYILLLEALARAVDSHPAFQMMWTEESSMQNIGLQAGYTHLKAAEYWMKVSARGAAAFKQGIFGMNFNWGLSSSSSPSRDAVTDRVVLTDLNGIGASDLRYSGSTGTLNTTFGFVFDRYAGVAPLHASVEWNTYAMGWTAKQLLDFGVDRLKLNFIGWLPRSGGSVTFDIHDAIAEIDRQGGRINRAPPTNILAMAHPTSVEAEPTATSSSGSTSTSPTGAAKDTSAPAAPRNLRALR